MSSTFNIAILNDASCGYAYQKQDYNNNNNNTNCNLALVRGIELPSSQKSSRYSRVFTMTGAGDVVQLAVGDPINVEIILCPVV